MASLKKPTTCSKCSNDEFHKLKKPERWACSSCDHVEVSRPMRNDPDICRECNKRREEVPEGFKSNQNICKPCANKDNRKSAEENPDRNKNNIKKYWGDRTKEERRASVRKSQERSVKSFLGMLAIQVRNRCKYDKKRAFANYDECDINTDYLLELWDKNDGKCALTGLPMVHVMESLYTVSVDRIDSGASYLQDNVQLVCKGANFLKNKHTQEETMQFIGNIIQKSEVMKDIAYFLRKIQFYLDKDDDACGAKRDLKRAMLLIGEIKPLPTGKHGCDCGRIVTDDEWDFDGNWCNNCLESYFEDKDRG